MDKAVLDIQGNLSFVQNAHWNLGYHFHFVWPSPPRHRLHLLLCVVFKD